MATPTLREQREFVRKLIAHETEHTRLLHAPGGPKLFPADLIMRGEVAACNARVECYREWLRNNQYELREGE
jgi:hypothetical protein